MSVSSISPSTKIINSNMKLTGRNFLYEGVDKKKYNFYHLETCRDGHCFVHAVLALTVADYHQLSDDEKRKMATALRKKVTDEIEANHSHIYENMIAVDDAGEFAGYQDEIKKKLIKHVEKEEIQTGIPVGFFSYYLERNIVVFARYVNKNNQEKPGNTSAVLKYNPEWPTIFIYIGDGHYEALLFKEEEDGKCKEDGIYSCVLEPGKKIVSYHNVK